MIKLRQADRAGSDVPDSHGVVTATGAAGTASSCAVSEEGVDAAHDERRPPLGLHHGRQRQPGGGRRVEHDPAALETGAAEFGADAALFDVTGHDVLLVAQTIKALCPGVTTVAMAVPEAADDVIACADAGFAAYIPRTASATEMLAIVDNALRGETVCAPRITRSLFDELFRRQVPTTPNGDPTSRQWGA